MSHLFCYLKVSYYLITPNSLPTLMNVAMNLLKYSCSKTHSKDKKTDKFLKPNCNFAKPRCNLANPHCDSVDSR